MMLNNTVENDLRFGLHAMLAPARAAALAGDGDVVAELLLRAACTSGQLASVAQAVFGIDYIEAVEISAQAPDLTQVGFTDCFVRAIYPMRLPGRLQFVVADPWDDDALQWLANRIGAYPLLVWARRSDIVAALELAQHRLKASSELGSGAVGSGGITHDNLSDVISIASIERSTSPVVRFVDAAIYDAWKAGASDIHFECNRSGVRVKLRLDGVLVPAAQLQNRNQAEEVISRIKVLSQLDIAERRIPQDGRFRAVLGDREVDFRVSIMPSIHGEDAVVRLLDKSQLRGADQVISLPGLGLDPDAIARIRRLARKPHGMLLVTGPTGSGKTTTLYAALTEIQSDQEKIITIEDPVEYELPGVLQIPVNEKKGLTFSQGLRSILRHDPDKILVGEIRDSETAEIAVQAALTGHLVFTTVHANSVFDVISRFVHMDIDLYSLMSALNGVVAQRLIRCNCASCSLPDRLAASGLQRCFDAGILPDQIHAARGSGCDHCRQTGYKGRHAVAEVLSFDDALRTMVLNRVDIGIIKQHVQALGVRPLGERALALVATGTTTIEEIDRVVAYD
jgi:general secretion pathway protein E